MLSSAVLRAVARPLQQGSASAGVASSVSRHSSSRGPAAASWQYYSTSVPRSSEAAAEDTADADADDAEAPPPPFVKADAKVASRQYNDRRAAYKRAVGKMRKSFAEEIAAQRKSDEEAAERKRAALTRQRLERQRAKNIQSARNAARTEEKRRARQVEFQEELRVAQINRDARNGRFAKARQLVVDELEAEAPLWLTTAAEVEAALDASGTQRLWARPGGAVGAPDPTDDASYWRYEAHTWDMSKTYSTPREELLRELEELSYLEANVSEEYWTGERMEEQRTLEDRAKLRAMVREEGRKELLMKQKRMMQDQYGHNQDTNSKSSKEGEARDGTTTIPRPMPAPKLDFLTNDDAMEREGVKILKDDPTKFFRFEDEGIVKAGDGGEGGEAADRATLGRPIGLRDPVREDASGMLDGTSPYPLNIGRDPRADTRTAAERKRDEREQRMLEAAQEAQAGEKKGSSSSSSSANIEQAAEETLEDGSDPIDYDAIGNAGDRGDREWEEGLDPDDPEDAEILATPRQHRYTEDDVDWVIDQLTDKTERLEELVRFEKEVHRQDMLAKMDPGDQEVADALGDSTKTEGVDERGRKFVQYDLEEDDDTGPSTSTDADADALLAQVESLQESLTAEQIKAIGSIDISKTADDEFMSSDDIAEALSKVPGLSEEQIQAMIDLEKSLEGNETIQEAFAGEISDEVARLLESDEAFRKAYEAGDKVQIAKELDRLLD